jgi:hypothetical protein
MIRWTSWAAFSVSTMLMFLDPYSVVQSGLAGGSRLPPQAL